MLIKNYIKSATSALLFLVADFFIVHGQNTEKIKGLTMVAPPQEWTTSPAPGLEDLNTEWVALIPYGYTRKGASSVRFNIEWQWWGEKIEGIRTSIKMAHSNGIKVMIKPQVYIHRGWVGSMDFESEEEWQNWENDYRTYVLTYAKIAAEENVHLFCIGTEYKLAVQERTAYWKDLIQKVRKIYPGKLVYSANWDSYADFPLWEDLDYIGVSAYFPLLKDKTPSVKNLRKAWKPLVKELEAFSKKEKRPVLFTEYGYMSVDGCAWRAWEIEKDLHQRHINQQGQANAYEALLHTFFAKDWWAGGFLWKYFPHMQGHEGYPEKDYTPQRKLAAEIVRKYYAQ
jgi:hypothetical protein